MSESLSELGRQLLAERFGPLARPRRPSPDTPAELVQRRRQLGAALGGRHLYLVDLVDDEPGRWSA